MAVFDEDLRLVFADGAALDGDALGFLPGTTLADLIPEDRLVEALSCAQQALSGVAARFDYRDLAGRRTWAVEVVPYRGPDTGPGSIAWLARDARAAKVAEDQLAHRALHDPLTGLANRQLFMDRLRQALARLYRTGSSITVLFLDLDRLKTVNDTLGHAVGDEVLVRVGRRLRRALRPIDTVARFGGDEFVVLCEDIEPADAERVARRLRSALAKPMVVEGREFRISASMGVRTIGDPHADPADVVREADVAMYRAKHLGRATFQLFDESMRVEPAQRVTMETELRRALAEEQLLLLYQPQVRLGDLTTVSAEALVRWRHPTRGIVDPQDFLFVAEETGLMGPIGAWILERICADIRDWPQEVGAAMNLGAEEIADPELIARTKRIVERAGVAPERLCFEVSETALFLETERALAALRGLRDHGFRVAIDDFGVGFSSLHHLRQLPPVDILKLDRTFISGLGRYDTDAAIVASVVLLTNSLGMEALGEGVETDEQLDLLRMMGCDYAQGFLFGRPQPVGKFLAGI